MTSATIKRGKPRKRRTNGTRKRNNKPGVLRRLFALIPLSSEQWRRLTTATILLALVAGGLFVAKATGVTDRASREFALAAGRAGFEVKRVELRGIDNVNELRVYEIVLAEQDRAMPLVDLEGLREELLAFGWIGDARVSRQLPDTLIVDIVERQPHAVWDDGTRLTLIDDRGTTLETVKTRNAYDLPLIKGENANQKVVGLNTLMEQAPALTPLVKEAQWIGNRRWNITFDSGETLALPEGEDAAASAYVNFARMDGVDRLLGRGVTYFDMRDPDRVFLRLPNSGNDAETQAAD